MVIKRRLAGCAAVLLVVAGLAACGTKEKAGSGGGGATETIKIALHFNVPQPSWIGIYMAQEKGFYTAQGIQLDLQYLKGSTLAVQSTGSGQSQIGLAAPDSVLAGKDKNLPVTVVANHIQNDATGVILKSKEPVSGLDALRGKTIATAQASAEAGLFAAQLKQRGLTDKVTVLNVDAQAKCTLMLSGKADGCTGFSYAQFIQMQLKGEDVQFIPFSSPDRPLPGAVIMVNNNYLAQHADVVKRFLQATYQGYQAAEKDQAGSIALIQKLDTTDPADQLAKAVPIIFQLSHSDRTRDNGWGAMTDAVWQNLVDELVSGAVLKTAPDLKGLYANDYLPADRSWT
ncbi:ABC transporter substrate-binding protein [Dactylosporangium sp. CA-233914]|uniref:ABC transporter substrate-binding protein n=1 Tax=Dactylosporangium sp. CA-233914 TaxID=3239934 RepID=UPI003D89FA32